MFNEEVVVDTVAGVGNASSTLVLTVNFLAVAMKIKRRQISQFL